MPLLTRDILATRAIMLFLMICKSSLAWSFGFQPTEQELRASTHLCQLAFGAVNKQTVVQTQEEKMLIWNVGGWHYCAGAVRVRRAEMAIDKKQRIALFQESLVNMSYSYSRIDKSNYWAAEMGTTIARAYDGLGNKEKAFEYLDQVIKYHPDYEAAFVVYGLVYYHDKNYIKAREFFEKALSRGNIHSAQTIYFLGLTSFKMGDYEAARKYSIEAKRLGYPLQGLDNMLSRAESVGQ